RVTPLPTDLASEPTQGRRRRRGRTNGGARVGPPEIRPRGRGGAAPSRLKRRSRVLRKGEFGPGSNEGNTWRRKARGQFGDKTLPSHHLRPEQRRRPPRKVLPWLRAT